MEVRIGIVQTGKELEIELAEDEKREDVRKRIDDAIASDGVLWLTDRKGREVAVPIAKLAYIEVGAPSSDRRVGFGQP
ncbi:MAG: DUF3107 domain-containing protein [Actinobacteria bacterium]|nr:DUF3107 domain-containing protein [Actinomycetota bacterium]